MGPAAIPHLLGDLKRESSDAASEFLESMVPVPVVGSVAEKLADQRRRSGNRRSAGEILVHMREYADRFVPELATIYQDPESSDEVSDRAASVLVALGPAAGGRNSRFPQPGWWSNEHEIRPGG
jgi:hypothetical protein